MKQYTIISPINRQNRLVDSLVTNGYWARSQAVYVMAQQYNAAGEAYVNWRFPGTNNITELGTPTWTSLRGSSTNSAGDGLNTNFNLSTDGGGVMTLYNATIIVYTLDDLATGNYYDVGSSNGTSQFSLAPNYGGSTYARINAGTATASVQTNSSGFFCGTRTADNRQELYRGGATLTEGTTSASAIPNFDVYVLGRNVSGTLTDISPNTVSFVMFINGLSDAEELEIFNFVEAYHDELSIGVH
jgi:hypothetical protein